MRDRCGAKNRAGNPCQIYPLKGKTRCKLHGGATPKGSANAATHGIYKQHLTAAEQDSYDTLKLGMLDHELRLTRIRLARALAAEHEANGAPELEELTENDGGGAIVPRETKKSRVKDYAQIIDRLTGRIESLEKSRKLLDADDGENPAPDGFEVVAYADTPAV